MALERGLQERACFAARLAPGTKIRSRGQGDANRTTYWCPSCQVAAQVPNT